jgi:alkanesulfonate monooxygenase SsuD/methylene tetrahydromethanopterin reductase-like flavin-dependent oxidoreductase (luciferase family)
MEIGIDTFLASNKVGHVQRNEDAIEYLLERISYAEEVGLDVYGIGEHHGPDNLDSAPTVILAAAAARTSKIRLTSAISGIGTLDPVRLFQDFATIDLISKGRAEIVAGRGASPEAWPLFGFDVEERLPLFIEKLGLLLLIRDNEFVTWSGKYRPAIDKIGIYPRPVQNKLPIWHAALRTPASAMHAGELGVPLMLAVIDGQIDAARTMVELYRETGEDAGFEEEDLKVGFHSMGYVAETTEQAIEEFYPGWAAAMTKIHGMPKSKTRFEIDLKTSGSSLLVGSPEDVAKKIIDINASFGGLDRFCFQMDYAGLPHEKLMKSIELIGKQVIPMVKK